MPGTVTIDRFTLERWRVALANMLEDGDETDRESAKRILDEMAEAQRDMALQQTPLPQPYPVPMPYPYTPPAPTYPNPYSPYWTLPMTCGGGTQMAGSSVQSWNS